MSKLLRRHRVMVRWVATVLLLAGWLVPLSVPHTANDDLLCVPADGVTTSAPVRVLPGGGDHRPDHCVICHAARTFRTTLAEIGSAIVVLASGPPVLPDPESSRRSSTSQRLPARAPPLA